MSARFLTRAAAAARVVLSWARVPPTGREPVLFAEYFREALDVPQLHLSALALERSLSVSTNDFRSNNDPNPGTTAHAAGHQ